MHIRSILVVALAMLGLATTASAADPSGNWKSTVTLNGQSFETLISLFLDSEGPTLTGFELDRDSNHKLSVRNTSFKASQIQFAVDHSSPGEKVVIHYRGAVSRDAIVGTAVFEFGDRTQTATWSAKRESTAGR